jgi:hypothetical protein
MPLGARRVERWGAVDGASTPLGATVVDAAAGDFAPSDI